MRQLRHNIISVSLVFLVGFLLICLMLGYWQVIRAPALRAHPYNDWAAQRAKSIEPGRIYTADGQVILGATNTAEGWQRTYPAAEVYAHLTGYNANTGLQWSLRDALLGRGHYESTWRNILNGHYTGLNVILTIDATAQAQATELMRGRRGAVVAIQPRTGAVLTLVSAPTYDPARILGNEVTYEMFRNDPTSPELNRGLQGLYPPGSVFAIFTAAAALDAGVATPETVFTCAGSETVAHTLITCHRRSGHGQLSLSQALADSCPIAFAKLAINLGPERFRQYVKRFHLLDGAKLSIPSQPGKMANVTADQGERKLAQAGSGQGSTLLTPLAIARLMATIANEGQVIQPYLVARIEEFSGHVVYRGRGQHIGRAISAPSAAQVEGMMVAGVEKGNVDSVEISGVEVGAMTATGSRPTGQPCSWTVAAAPAGHAQAVVVVVVENEAAGDRVAGPIASKVLKTLIRR